MVIAAFQWSNTALPLGWKSTFLLLLLQETVLVISSLSQDKLRCLLLASSNTKQVQQRGPQQQAVSSVLSSTTTSSKGYQLTPLALAWSKKAGGREQKSIQTPALRAVRSPGHAGPVLHSNTMQLHLVSAGSRPGLLQYALNLENQITVVRQHLASLRNTHGPVLCSVLKTHKAVSGNFLLIPDLHALPNTAVAQCLMKHFQISSCHVYI